MVPYWNSIIIIFRHEIRPWLPVSASAVMSSSNLLSDRPGLRLPFGWYFRSCFGRLLSSIIWTCWNQLCLMYKVFVLRVWQSSKIPSFLLWLRRVCPAVRRKYFISAVRCLVLSHCSTVQISLPYKRVGRANVLYNFNLVLLWTKFVFRVLLKIHSFCNNFVLLECMS
jgi:hypothetical protein